MSGTFLQPRSGSRAMARRQDEGDPFLPLRRQMSRLFDDFFSPMLPQLQGIVPPPTLDVVVSPRIEVSETDKEVRITAELPGIDPQNVEVSLDDDVLTIRGEKVQQEERDDQQRNYHLTERTYGTFARYLRLPFHVEPDSIQASFRDGVLTITIPKPEEVQQKVHRIPVEAAQSGNGSQQSAGSQSASGEGSQQSSGTQAQQGTAD